VDCLKEIKKKNIKIIENIKKELDSLDFTTQSFFKKLEAFTYVTVWILILTFFNTIMIIFLLALQL